MVTELSSGSEAAAEIIDALAEGRLLPVNSTEITGAHSLQQAVAMGHQLINKTLESDGFIFVIDIVASHKQITPLP